MPKAVTGAEPQTGLSGAKSDPIPPEATCVFRGVIFDVYQWQQPLFDGSTTTFEKLKRADGAAVVPVTPDGRIIVSHQEQPARPPFRGLIAGRVEPGEEPQAGAARELLEETGYQAERWELFSTSQPNSKVEWTIYTYLAHDCRPVAAQRIDPGERITLEFLTFDGFLTYLTSDDYHQYATGLRDMAFRCLLDPAVREAFRQRLLGT